MKVNVFAMPTIPATLEERERLRPVGRNTERYQMMLQELRDLVKAADALGIEAFGTTEHHFHTEGGEACPNPLLMYSHLAAITERIAFVPMSIVLPADDPIRIAEDVALFDQMYPGRVGVCFARGYQKRWIQVVTQRAKFTSWEDEDADRVNREVFDEYLEVVIKAWTEETFDFNGKHYQVPYPHSGIEGWAAPDLPAAAFAIVAARVEQGGEAAFVVDLDAAGARVDAQPLHDVSRPCGRLTLTGVRVEADAALAGGGALVGELVDRGALALAAEAVGGAERALEMTIEHLRARHQFGRPLGSFQALKHRCADVHLRILAARAAVDHAALAVGRDDERPLAAAIAKAKACEAYVLAATEAVQMHGAIGFTWEHDAHLHLKRAKLAEALLGDPDHQRDRVAALALPGAAT